MDKEKAENLILKIKPELDVNDKPLVQEDMEKNELYKILKDLLDRIILLETLVKK